MNRSLEKRALTWAFLVALLSLGCAEVMAGSIKMMTDSNPAPMSTISPEVSPELVAQGHQFYGMSCSHCHGDDAHGDEGPDLHNLFISNARIAVTIKKGIKGEMPAFSKRYDDHQIAALVSYLRSLR